MSIEGRTQEWIYVVERWLGGTSVHLRKNLGWMIYQVFFDLVIMSLLLWVFYRYSTYALMCIEITDL